MEMYWLQSIKDLKYLLFLLVPVGIYLIVIGIKKVRGFAKAKMIYEIPVSSIDGSFTLEDGGKYDIWLSGKKYSASPIYNLNIKLKNNATGKFMQLYPDFLGLQQTVLRMSESNCIHLVRRAEVIISH